MANDRLENIQELNLLSNKARALSLKPFRAKQVQKYGAAVINFVEESKLLPRYISKVSIDSEVTGRTYKGKLTSFCYFIYSKIDSSKPLDETLNSVGSGQIDPYDLLQDYATWLKSENTSPNSIRSKVKLARRFLKYCGASIPVEDFKDSVSLPKQRQPVFKPLEKSEVVELLQSCKNQRLKTLLVLLGGTGARITELCSVRNCDIELSKGTISFREEYTKTRTARTRYLTKEGIAQIQTWLKIKYAPHRSVNNGKSENVTPEVKPDDLLLAYWSRGDNPTVEGIVMSVRHEFNELAKMLNVARSNGRRVITFHRFRAYVLSTIANLGYGDFGDWIIGHANNTYYRSPEKTLLEVFAKIEPYLTFADSRSLEGRYADMESKLESALQELAKTKENYAGLFKVVQGFAAREQAGKPKLSPEEQAERDQKLLGEYEAN